MVMERMYGGGGTGSLYEYESGVVMTRDPKPRLRWTSDLHDRFVHAVTKLGGPDSNYSLPLFYLIHILFMYTSMMLSFPFF